MGMPLDGIDVVVVLTLVVGTVVGTVLLTTSGFEGLPPQATAPSTAIIAMAATGAILSRSSRIVTRSLGRHHPNWCRSHLCRFKPVQTGMLLQ